jgi:hypothetical protein
LKESGKGEVVKQNGKLIEGKVMQFGSANYPDWKTVIARFETFNY